MDLFTKDVYSGCNVIDVLVILKDLRIVGLSQFLKNDLSSYYVKTTLLWCMDERQGLNRSELIDFTLQKLSSFYAETHLPDFFDEKSNLISHVPKQTTEKIRIAIEDIRKNVGSLCTECETRQNVLKQKCKEKVLGSGFNLLLPFLTKDVLLKVFYEYLIGSGYPKDAIDIFYRNDDSKLEALFSKTLLALGSATNKLLKLNFKPRVMKMNEI